MTYREAGEARTAIGSGFVHLGVTPGSTIGIYSINSVGESETPFCISSVFFFLKPPFYIFFSLSLSLYLFFKFQTFFLSSYRVGSGRCWSPCLWQYFCPSIRHIRTRYSPIHSQPCRTLCHCMLC